MKPLLPCLLVSVCLSGCSSSSSPSAGNPPASQGGSLSSGGASVTGGASTAGAISASGATASGGAVTGGATSAPVAGSGGQSGGASSSHGGLSSGGALGAGATSGGGPLAGAGASGSGGGSTGVAGGAGMPDPSSPVGRHGPLSVMGTQLVNQRQEPVQLKGPSSMWLNWESKPFAEDKQGLQWMRDNWKASVVRAAMGVSTPQDTEDKEYLADPATAQAQVEKIIQNAIELGLYVIVDWHDSSAEMQQAEAITFFKAIAQKYGAYPNVIYETFNEPIRQSWANVLKPYHQALVAAIRESDPDNVIILGTPNWSQFVDQAAADPVPGTNLMYTLHFYSCSHKAELRERGDKALAMGLPLFVTEWGATHADGGTTRNPTPCVEEANAWHDWMNAKKISWTAWKWDQCVDTTCYFAPGIEVPTSGNWTEEMLNGEHIKLVRDRMKE